MRKRPGKKSRVGFDHVFPRHSDHTSRMQRCSRHVVSIAISHAIRSTSSQHAHQRTCFPNRRIGLRRGQTSCCRVKFRRLPRRVLRGALLASPLRLLKLQQGIPSDRLGRQPAEEMEYRWCYQNHTMRSVFIRHSERAIALVGRARLSSAPNMRALNERVLDGIQLMRAVPC